MLNVSFCSHYRLSVFAFGLVFAVLFVAGCGNSSMANADTARQPAEEENPEPMVHMDETTTMEKVKKTKEQWKKELDAQTYHVTCQAGTERPFTGKYWNHKEEGIYVDKLSGMPLFSSKTKFESGSGWPSFYDLIEEDNVILREDNSHGMKRIEIISRASGAHLGHVFKDGPGPTGLRYCINSAALEFVPGPTELPDPDVPSLQAQLNARREAWSEKADADTKATYQQGIETLREQGVTEQAIKQGQKAPDFSLPNATGETVQLSQLLENGPVVLTWYRGGWCPYCNIQLQTYQQVLPKIKEYDATLVAVSPELPDKSLSTKEKNELDFVVLSDQGNEVAKQYGLVYTLPQPVQEKFKGKLDLAAYNGDDSGQLPLAATYVIDRDGQVVYSFVDADYRKRAEPTAILQALEQTTAEPAQPAE